MERNAIPSARCKRSVYFYENISLCREVKLGFAETKEQVITGLLQKELSNFLITYKDEDGLYKDNIQHDYNEYLKNV